MAVSMFDISNHPPGRAGCGINMPDLNSRRSTCLYTVPSHTQSPSPPCRITKGITHADYGGGPG